MIESVRLAFFSTFLVVASLAYAQQAQQPPPRSAGGPAADQKAIFERGLEMYKAKSYSNALRAFRYTNGSWGPERFIQGGYAPVRGGL